MDATRRARLESLMQSELTQLLSRNTKDPRISPVIVTTVQLSNDGKTAKVFVTLQTLSLDTPHEVANPVIQKSLIGLRSAAPFLKQRLERILQTRIVPDLVFVEDKGLENSLRVHELLKQIQTPNK